MKFSSDFSIDFNEYIGTHYYIYSFFTKVYFKHSFTFDEI